MKLLNADALLEKIFTHFSNKDFRQHFLLTSISTEMILAANIFFDEKQQDKGLKMLEILSHWIKDDLNYFISFKGASRKMYEWDIVSGLQMMDAIIRVSEKNGEREFANQLLKDYYRLNIEYSSDSYSMKMKMTA